MKARLMALCVLSFLAGRLDSAAQTNLPSPILLTGIEPSIDPAASKLELRCETFNAAPKIPRRDFNLGPLPFRPEDRPPPPRLPARAALSPSLTTSIADREEALFARLNEDRAWRKSIANEGLFSHAMRRTFEPEVAQFHHVYFASSILTAIKRKNPFSLLNPQVLWVAW